MLFRVFIIGFMLLGVSRSEAEQVQALIDQTLAGLDVVASDDPYSSTLRRMFIGWDENGKAKKIYAGYVGEEIKPI